jgi:hypothetical protein
MPMLQELSENNTEELQEKIKEVENNILNKIKKYNEEIKVAEKEENELRTLQNKAYKVSELFRKALRLNQGIDLSSLENQLTDLDTQIQSVLENTLNSKSTALVTLQSLYKEHVEYLSSVANGFKTRCEKLESLQRSDNIV